MSITVALAGNPNVGKSTVFNALTGLRQHTGNWAGKTVSHASGICSFADLELHLVDLPGCYSLMAHSVEEEVARDYICFQHPDAVIVVCDSTCLERNLNLVLQILEASGRVMICVNFMDEAERKRIRVDLEQLSKRLQVPVLGITAREKKGLNGIFTSLQELLQEKPKRQQVVVRYPLPVEQSIDRLLLPVKACMGEEINLRWLCARLLEADEKLLQAMREHLRIDPTANEGVAEILAKEQEFLEQQGFAGEKLKDEMAASFIRRAEQLAREVVHAQDQEYAGRDRKLDRFFTSPLSGFPIMLLLLLGVFWITISGANIPSQLLSRGLTRLGDRLLDLALWCHIPSLIYEPFLFGVYRVIAWVVSVMLPPMAIFFPLFTVLEDFGYLPRIAYNLDCCFKKCAACGKQALTMCMGFLNL